jgi:endonuclease YncB( thermonuclease family)
VGSNPTLSAISRGSARLLDDEYINVWMVAEGHAWVYREYSNDPDMLELEVEAQEQGADLWALPEAERLPPREWRRSKRQ